MCVWTDRLLHAGVLFLLTMVSVPGMAALPHLAGMACAECHLAGEETTTDNAGQLLRSQEALCKQCHPGALTVAHPTGFKARRPLPVQYPLDWKGDVTCSTCHEVHGTQPGRLRGGKRYKEFCLSCHEQAFFRRMPDEGLSIQHGGHIAGLPQQLAVPIDQYSLHCLSCHGDKARGVPVNVDERGIVRHGSGSANHPIGVMYDEIARDGSFHPAAMLRREIMLPDGMVSCVSCHVGYAEKHGALVISNYGSALCLSCHDK